MTNNFQQESEDLIQEKGGVNNLGDSTQKSELVCPMPTPKQRRDSQKSDRAGGKHRDDRLYLQHAGRRCAWDGHLTRLWHQPGTGFL